MRRTPENYRCIVGVRDDNGDIEDVVDMDMKDYDPETAAYEVSTKPQNESLVSKVRIYKSECFATGSDETGLYFEGQASAKTRRLALEKMRDEIIANKEAMFERLFAVIDKAIQRES